MGGEESEAGVDETRGGVGYGKGGEEESVDWRGGE